MTNNVMCLQSWTLTWTDDKQCYVFIVIDSDELMTSNSVCLQSWILTWTNDKQRCVFTGGTLPCCPSLASSLSHSVLCLRLWRTWPQMKIGVLHMVWWVLFVSLCAYIPAPCHKPLMVVPVLSVVWYCLFYCHLINTIPILHCSMSQATDSCTEYGLVSIVCISVCLHPCSMSQATDGGSCTEYGLVSIVCFIVTLLILYLYCTAPCHKPLIPVQSMVWWVLLVALSSYYTYATLLHVTSHWFLYWVWSGEYCLFYCHLTMPILPCSISQGTDGGSCAELSMARWVLFVKIQEEILVGVCVCVR